MNAKSYDFAYIVGRDPRNDPPYGPQNERPELETVLEAVGVMVNSHKHAPYQCTVLRQRSDSLEQFELQVWPKVQSYRCVNKATGDVDSYDAETDVYVVANERREREPRQFMTVPVAAALAFPMNLYVWGLPFEGFRMIGASRLDDEIFVQIEHQSEPNLFGCITIDTQRRLVTSLDTRIETLRCEEIVPMLARPSVSAVG